MISSKANIMRRTEFSSEVTTLIKFYFQSVPGVGGDKKEDEGLTREELQEQERLR